MTSPITSPTITLIEAYYAAFNAGDMQGFLALLTDDVAHDINQSSREIGIPAFAAFMDDMNRCYAEKIEDLVILTEATGTRAAAEFTVHGKYLQAGHGMPAAHGQAYTLPAGAFFTLRANKIARISNYYNLPAWLAQVS
ncbi:MAG: nuclear transport factor 2 family protein [Acidocella sp.]|nr:nuclear transport factor 2 family protein [Acidocella sp.]